MEISQKIDCNLENQMMKIKNLHGAILSNKVVFAGFNHMKFRIGLFIYLYMSTPANMPWFDF